MISAAGAGYDGNRDDFVHGLELQVGADPQAATRSTLPDGRSLISFTENPITTAVTFSGCYALVVEAGDPGLARSVASLLH